MANQHPFPSMNPFSNKNKTRRGSTAKAPPKPPSQPPKKIQNGIPDASHHMRRQLIQYQNMYKQTKNQLEVLKSQYKGIEKELNIYKSQKQAIDANHSNIITWQKKISQIELEKQTLIDKNGLFLQQKNTYLLQLANEQEQCDELKMEIENKNSQINKLENELLNSTQNYTQQLSKKDNKYKNLKIEYNSLNKEYINIKNGKDELINKLNDINTQSKDIKQEHLLLKDNHNKLQIKYDLLKTNSDQLKQQISQVKGDSSIAVSLAQKKDKNIIKDLRQTLKTETMKCQQFRGEYLQLKDELNDLRDWRENYLRQQKLAQTQNNIPNNITNNNSEDIQDNASTTSSSSKNSRNSITIKNKLKIMKHKSVTAIKNVELPSFTDLLSNEFNVVDDEKVAHDANNNNNNNNNKVKVHTTAHDDFIEALSNRLAVVKENYINLKGVLSVKNEEICNLNFELDKKKEMIGDLIEKLNDKPLPPTPMELSKLETHKNKNINIETDEDKVLMNLEQQGLCPQLNDNNVLKSPPPIPMQSPPSIPIPKVSKVVVSPSYNKGIEHNVYISYSGNNDDNDNNNNNINVNEIKKLKENKYQNYPKSYTMNEGNNNENQLLVGNHINDEDNDEDNDGI